MSEWTWKFAKKNDNGRDLTDDFRQLKFSSNYIGSFCREIMQNSNDAFINNETPVKVVFKTKEIEASKVPGINTIKDTLEKCLKNIENPETRRKFQKAIDFIKNNKIECLKVSDFNTKGMSQDAWDALLYKNGVSSKNNTHSAGRFGVGKKAVFLMTLCNTLYYSSKYHNVNTNKDEIRFNGKSVLVDFEEKNEWFSKNGWYEQENQDLTYTINDYNEIDEFFLRKDKYGSDVIIPCLMFTNEEDLKKKIISSILDNFYIGIMENKIEAEYNGIVIKKTNIQEIINIYYEDTFGLDAQYDSRIAQGLIKEYSKAYLDNIDNKIIIDVPGFKESYIDLYIYVGSEKLRKYYSFYRDHGMKIRDYRFTDADKAYSAIVVARGKELNEFLLSMENEAHNDFEVDENLSEEEKKNIKAKKKSIFSAIENKIKSLTKLPVTDEIDLEELNDIIDNPGELTRKVQKTKTTKKKKHEIKAKVQVNTTNITEQEWMDRFKNLDPHYIPDPDPNVDPSNDKAPFDVETDENGNEIKKAFRKVEFEKLLMTVNNYYLLRFSFKFACKNLQLKVIAKNIDDKLNDVNYMIDHIEFKGKTFDRIKDGYIFIGDLEKEEMANIKIYLNNNARYKLFADVVGKHYEEE